MEETKRTSNWHPMGAHPKPRPTGEMGAKEKRASTQWSGFGGSPPRRSRSVMLAPVAPVLGNATLMKDAEKLVQLMLGSDEKLSKASIDKATQQIQELQNKNQTKKRYSHLLEKPWRTTPSEHCRSSSHTDDDAHVTEIQNKNPKSFRRTNSEWAMSSKKDSLDDLLVLKEELDQGMGASSCHPTSHMMATELSRTKSQLKRSKDQVVALRKEVSVLKARQQQHSMEDSLLSFAEDSGYVGMDNDTSHSIGTSSSQTIQLLQAKIRALEAELAQERKELETGADILQENKALLSKVESLEKTMAIEEKFKEQKRLQAHENQLKIDDLEKQLAEYEEKLTEQESRQCEQVQSLLDQIAKSEEQLSKQETRHRSEMQEALKQHTVEVEEKYREQKRLQAHETQGKIAALEKQLFESQTNLAERETRQSEQVQSLLKQLAKADEKLSEQETRHRHEMLEASEKQRADLEDKYRDQYRLKSSSLLSKINQLEKQLSVSKEKLNEQESRHCSEMEVFLQQQASQQAALDSQNEANQRISQLQEDLAAANEKAHGATKRLEELEQAQAQEQGILSQEVRESESTIVCLMDELNSLRPLSAELERTHQELKETRSKLEKADQKVAELAENTSEMLDSLKESRREEALLREELDLLAPLATDLEMAEEALDETTLRLQQMEERMKKLKGRRNDEEVAKELKAFYEAQTAELHDELSATYEESKLVRQKAETLELEHKAELDMLLGQLKEAKDKSASLERELDILRPKLLHAEKNSDGVTEAEEEAKSLQNLLAQKEKEIESLNAEVAEQQKQITSSRLQIEEMDEERHYARAKVKELSSLANARAKGGSESQDRLQARLTEKTEQCAKLTAERDTIKQKLNVLEAMVTALELDNKQKKQLVHELMSAGKSGRSASKSGKSGRSASTAEVFIASLQSEQERTLKRCSDLSLQLAESQFKIDELTQKLRKVQRSNSSQKPVRPSRSSSLAAEQQQSKRSFSMTTAFTRQGSNIKAMLNNGIQRGVGPFTDSEDEAIVSSSERGVRSVEKSTSSQGRRFDRRSSHR